MKVTFTGFGLISGMLAFGICSSSVNAQVIPDGTDTEIKNYFSPQSRLTITQGSLIFFRICAILQIIPYPVATLCQ